MQYGQWIGRTALALIFLFNALGIVDQTRPAHELAAHGAPAALVPTLIVAGRVLQLAAGIALLIGWHERIAALLLTLFLIPATLAAHDFWASHGPEFQGQLVNFLKNFAIFGGLCFVAFRLPTAAAGGPNHKAFLEGLGVRGQMFSDGGPEPVSPPAHVTIPGPRVLRSLARVPEV